jgi:long chain fatty acid CoA FadD26
MAAIESSIPALLQQRADKQPNTTAYTFIDYEVDPAGYTESLTWSQVHRRAQNVAEELESCGSAGDRAAILAPQGLDYIAAFLGAMQAGFIAVPLSVPQFGGHDVRVTSVMRDCSPTVVLTTSSAADEVVKYARDGHGRPAPTVVEVDALDLDSERAGQSAGWRHSKVAYLQYTSGSTRAPAGVVVLHRNVFANLEQVSLDYFGHTGYVSPPETTIVSWLPFFHDMGLMLGVCLPLVFDRSAVLLSPMSFLQRPARWMQLLADKPKAFTAAPNFALELAARRTSDDDMSGRDLGDVLAIVNGSERIHAATLARFKERFVRFNLRETAIRPSYGLAEATVYVATASAGRPPKTVQFDYAQLSIGRAMPGESGADGSTELVSYGELPSTTVRIVDPATETENPPGTVGEIWVHGENVASGYWRNPELTEKTFGARLLTPSAGTPHGPWLRTGDLGVIFDGELFIIGRIKDLLIVDGRNHYPDDIEATVQEITRGRVAAISVPNERTEHLVAIVELKNRANGSTEETTLRLRSVKRDVTSAISKSHGVRVMDLVLVPPGSIPITTSGKIRRSACVEQYTRHQFARLDAST